MRAMSSSGILWRCPSWKMMVMDSCSREGVPWAKTVTAETSTVITKAKSFLVVVRMFSPRCWQELNTDSDLRTEPNPFCLLYHSTESKLDLFHEALGSNSHGRIRHSGSSLRKMMQHRSRRSGVGLSRKTGYP